MGNLIDSCVLFYGLHGMEKGKRGSLTRQEQGAIEVMRQGSLHISAASWMEVHRTSRPEHHAMLQRLERGLRIHAVTPLIARRAGELLRLRQRQDNVCAVCLNPTAASFACKACKQKTSANRKTLDALVIATAEMVPHIQKLFTHDGPMREWASTLSGFEAHDLPHVFGPLFKHAEEQPASP
jgi:predicted nucleic acid-binding protein